ncbi:MAG: hypothetical protein WKF84_06355 [Pyrinomonadaceae bacterium]
MRKIIISPWPNAEGELAFLYKLERGSASKSYGIEVARLAGLPASVVARARDVLSRLERCELDVFAEDAVAPPLLAATAGAGDDIDDVLERAARKRARQRSVAQATLFDLANQTLLEELKNMKPSTLSEDEAKEFLRNLQRRVI